MKINITALFDEATRKEIKEAVLGYARGIARSEVEAALKAEVKRIGVELNTQIESASRNEPRGWRFKDMVREMLGTTLRGMDLRPMIADIMGSELEPLVQKAVARVTDENVAKKLRDKTVWEASKQDEYVRRVVRSELKKILGNTDLSE